MTLTGRLRHRELLTDRWTHSRDSSGDKNSKLELMEQGTALEGLKEEYYYNKSLVVAAGELCDRRRGTLRLWSYEEGKRVLVNGCCETRGIRGLFRRHQLVIEV